MACILNIAINKYVFDSWSHIEEFFFSNPSIYLKAYLMGQNLEFYNKKYSQRFEYDLTFALFF